jgi:cold shock CspA family protein
VFESINDTGKALDEFDLLRNDLFLRVGDREKQKKLYNQYWRDFDEESLWEGTGKVDEFLEYFLTAKLGPIDFRRKRLFHDVYKAQYHEKLRLKLGCDENNDEFINKEFEELAKYAATYQEMETDLTTNIGRRRLFYRDLNRIFEDLDLTNLPPFLLHVKNELELDENERDQVYKILESYVLRCQLRHGVSEDKTTRERISGLFTEVIDGNIKKSEIAKAFAAYLSASGKRGRRWLGNQGIRDGFRKVSDQMDNLPSSLRKPIWNMLGYILYQIECFKQKEMPIAFKEFLSRFQCTPIIFPSKFQKAFSDKHSIGNLTFCDEYPPPSGFPDRRKFLFREPNASLMLNMGMDKDSTWGVPQIDARTNSLLTCFHNIWPPAEHFLENAAESKVEFSVSQTSKPRIEPRWISLIQSDNSQSITFVTYSRVEELSGIKMLGGKIIGINHTNSEQTLAEQDILFTCSSTAWTEIYPYVEILNYVRSERLQSPRNQGERLNVVDKIFTSAQQEQTMVSLVTRYGHLLEGTIENFDKDAICFQIREHPVVVYRHSIYELATGEWDQGEVTEFNKVDGFGYIESNEHPRIFVHINEIRGRSISTLQLGQKVEFDLNRTMKGLSAIDVELIKE